MEPIRVVINGAFGRMGQEITKAVVCEPGFRVVGAVEKEVTQQYLPLTEAPELIVLSADLDSLLKSCDADVVVDFSIAQATMPMVRIATQRGVSLVIGTTGLAADDITEIEQLARDHRVGAVVAPNFALGAVLMMHLAKVAAEYFDYAEIIELHHHLKADAPSGTALSTARKMAEARGKPFDVPEHKRVAKSRGEQVEGVGIHSVRLPGLLAHQEVILGGPGQTLSVRHDTISRECFMPGVIIAIKKVIGHKGLIYGLDALLGLERT